MDDGREERTVDIPIKFPQRVAEVAAAAAEPRASERAAVAEWEESEKFLSDSRNIS